VKEFLVLIGAYHFDLVRFGVGEPKVYVARNGDAPVMRDAWKKLSGKKRGNTGKSGKRWEGLGGMTKSE